TTSSPERPRARRPWHLLGVLLSVLLIALAPAAALAQGGSDPSQVGVDDHDDVVTVNLRYDNEPVEGARVVISGGGFEAEATTSDRGQARFGVPTTDPYEVLVDEETLPEGVTVTGDNPLTVSYGSQFFQPANFFLGEGERETSSFLDQFVERFINGLNFGLMLALASIGLSLLFGT